MGDCPFRLRDRVVFVDLSASFADNLSLSTGVFKSSNEGLQGTVSAIKLNKSFSGDWWSIQLHWDTFPRCPIASQYYAVGRFIGERKIEPLVTRISFDLYAKE